MTVDAHRLTQTIGEDAVLVRLLLGDYRLHDPAQVLVGAATRGAHKVNE